MAYLVDLDHLCDRCQHNRARKRLFTHDNHVVGDYCVNCAKRQLEQMQESERAHGITWQPAPTD